MLLGRERELELIGRLLDAARAGRSGVLALTGEAGIGKSSLLARAAADAPGMRVLEARGVQSEAQIPFAGLFELLRPALDGVERLPAPQAAALESALALRPARAHDRFAVGAATLSLLAAYAEPAPLLVLVDDVQWLDGSSADAVRFALRRLLADPIAVILTVRDGEPSLLDGAGLAVQRVAGLKPEAVVELLRRRLPRADTALALRLHRETGGNPLALLELASEPLSDVPLETPLPVITSVAEVYLQRARSLPEPARRALVVAAASDGCDLAVVARAASGLGLEVGDLAPAEERGLVSLSAGRVEFRHPLARSAIYGDAAPEQRRAAHRALANALPDAQADRRAWHLALAAAGPDEAASSALEQAGARARQRSAYDVASRALERAALLAPAGERRARLAYAAADAAWLAGLGTRAASLLERAAQQASDEGLATDIEHLRGHIALRRGPLAEGRAILRAAASRAAPRAPEQAVIMLAEAAEGAFFAGDAAGMRECGEEARALAAGAAGPRAAFFGQMAAGMGRVLAGAEDGPAMIRAAVAVAQGSDEVAADLHLLAWAAMGPLWLREAGASRSLVDLAVATARVRTAAGTLPHLLLHVGIDQAATDRFAEAQGSFEEAIRHARESGQETVLAGALARLAWVEARCGRDGAGRAHAAEALELARRLGTHLFEVWGLIAVAELELAAGRAEAALACLEEQQATLERHRIADVDLSQAPERVELLLRLGRPAEAAAAAAPFLEAAAAKRQPWALARAARCRGLLAPEAGLDAPFEQALALHARTPDAFEAARTRLAYGARLRRTGRRRPAREQLRAGFADFEKLGAVPWAEMARVELRATGETARRRDPSTADQLTPQELQIMLLLADGRTTREAAAALFLSPKTIEYHLRNGYRKLGVHSRQELAGALRGAR